MEKKVGRLVVAVPGLILTVTNPTGSVATVVWALRCAEAKAREAAAA
jgi:hypothetical protein